MSVRDYRDLIVWQRSAELIRIAYGVARRLPPEERFELSSQIRGAAVSVSANIAEGHSRRHRSEFLQFLGIAYASLKELDSHLLAAEAATYVDRATIADALAVSSEVSRMLVAMRRRLGEPLNARR